MEGYRNYKAIIKQAELTAMSPDTVMASLEKRANQTKDEWRDDLVDEGAEAALLARHNPLINLALAKYGRFIATLKPLFKANEPLSAIRLSVLSNTVAEDGELSQFPVSLFDEKEQAAAWLVTAPDVELAALFDNPHINDLFLRGVLESEKPWDVIPSDRLATIVLALHNNERMRRPFDDNDWARAYDELSYGAVFNAAWCLAGRVEPTPHWAAALHYLYDRLATEGYSVGTPLEFSARWHTDPSDTEAVSDESKMVELGCLSHYQEVRRGLARLALSQDPDLFPVLMASEDLAFRSAAYSDGAISPEQLSAAYERDGELAFNLVKHNHKIWRSQPGRDALKAIAWSITENDTLSNLGTVQVFYMIRKNLMKEHPDWFKDDEDLQP